MLESADRADLQPVTELYGGKRHCRKVSKTNPIETPKKYANKCSTDIDLSWEGQCPMTLVTLRMSPG